MKFISKFICTASKFVKRPVEQDEITSYVIFSLREEKSHKNRRKHTQLIENANSAHLLDV